MLNNDRTRYGREKKAEFTLGMLYEHCNCSIFQIATVRRFLCPFFDIYFRSLLFIFVQYYCSPSNASLKEVVEALVTFSFTFLKIFLMVFSMSMRLKRVLRISVSLFDTWKLMRPEKFSFVSGAPPGWDFFGRYPAVNKKIFFYFSLRNTYIYMKCNMVT